MSDHYGRMPEHEGRAAHRVAGRTVAHAGDRDLAMIAVVARRLVPAPLGARQRIDDRHRRQRVLDADELPDTSPLDVEQDRRTREIEGVRRQRGGGREHVGGRVHEVEAVGGFHAAELDEAVLACACDVQIARRRGADVGDNVFHRACRVGPADRGLEQKQDDDRHDSHEPQAYNRQQPWWWPPACTIDAHTHTAAGCSTLSQGSRSGRAPREAAPGPSPAPGGPWAVDCERGRSTIRRAERPMCPACIATARLVVAGREDRVKTSSSASTGISM